VEPTIKFRKALDEALASLTQVRDETLTECPESTVIMGHARGLQADADTTLHIQNCISCGRLFETTQRQRPIYEMQKRAFAAMAENKYGSRTGVIKQGLRPFAWLVQPRALVAQVAIAVVVVGATFFAVPGKRQPGSVTQASTSSAQSDMNARVKETVETAAQADPALDPALAPLKAAAVSGSQIDPTQLATAREAIQQIPPAATPDLSQTRDAAARQLMAYELVTRAQAKGASVPVPSSVPVDNNGTLTIYFAHDPILNDQNKQAWQQSALETKGLGRTMLSAGQTNWKLNGPRFEVQAAIVPSQKSSD
jgi:hypothetical protein